MTIFDVQGMTCGGCARAVTGAIKAIDPASDVVTDVAGRTVTVRGSLDPARVTVALAEIGYLAVSRD